MDANTGGSDSTGGDDRSMLDSSDKDVPPKAEVEKVTFCQLFRFSDQLDVFLMITGTLCMVCVGGALPMNLFFFGDLITKFVAFDANGLASGNATGSGTLSAEIGISQCTKTGRSEDALSSEELFSLIQSTYVPAFISIGSLTLIIAYIGISFWVWTGERQIRRIRSAYFEAVMRQSVGWFDVRDTGGLNTRMVEEMDRLSDGFGDKVATFVQWVATFIGGYCIGFVSGWKLTLVTISMSPLLVIVGSLLGRFLRTIVSRELEAYAKGGAVAEETFASIRTVAAFGGEKKAEEKYSVSLGEALTEAVRKATITNLLIGLIWLIIFGMFALAFWYGSKLTREECMHSGALLQVFFGVLLGSLSLGQAMPLLENFGNAQGAAALLFKTIDDPVEIDSSSEEGLKLDKLEGTIEFEHVSFRYPARQEVQILDKLNLSVKKGETVALVGESGCGKSTTIQLLQRFYECESGKVLIDGRDLRECNLATLRNHMGVVSQEPVLFATTIGENIRLGGIWGEEVTDALIHEAAKQANCFDFIMDLPKGFETMVGERGVQLSGGQKQRIAIARALVRNPAILLLDEATSALDTQSEAVVQDALDKASEGRTTIVIAHRLSTVRSANKIVALKQGKVYEQGTHDELMADKGLYYSLVRTQQQKQQEEKEQHKKDLVMRQSSVISMKSNVSEDLPETVRRANSRSPRKLSEKKGSLRSLQNILGFKQPVECEDEELALEQDELETRSKLEGRDTFSKREISMGEILKMNQPEWALIVGGSIAAVINGVVNPTFSVLLSEMVGILSEPDLKLQTKLSNELVGYIMMVGIIAAIAFAMQGVLFAMSGERMTMRLRKQSFAAIARQEIGYFDDGKNGVGALTSRLASDSSLVKGATGIRIGMIIQCTSAILACLVIGFVFVWELMLIMLVFMPIMIMAEKIQTSLVRGFSNSDKESIEEGGKMAQEAIGNIRTVTSLNQQKYFVHKFYTHFKSLYKKELKKSFLFGISYAVSQSMLYFMVASCFGLGGYLILCDCIPWRSERIPFFHVLRVYAVINLGSSAIGRAIAQIPDLNKAKAAAYNIKKLLGRKSEIDPTDMDGNQPEKCHGDITFSDVEFFYPTRKAVQILQGLNVQIKRGEKVALVGSSGCGKSTSISLLERFYNIAAGKVLLDGNDVTSLNTKWLRKNLGIVQQEPSLMDTSIAENIAYGDNSREVTITEIMEAAKKANAHNFITQLPQGYETNVGAKGTQLSGGQKQRIAIARALVRNPAILLLDEATSALDTESEKIVQEALDEAMRGRTAIIIAHRLSTIRNADRIGVIDGGKLVEVGTHQQLIAKRGYYYNLVNAQL